MPRGNARGLLGALFATPAEGSGSARPQAWLEEGSRLRSRSAKMCLVFLPRRTLQGTLGLVWPLTWLGEGQGPLAFFRERQRPPGSAPCLVGAPSVSWQGVAKKHPWGGVWIRAA